MKLTNVRRVPLEDWLRDYYFTAEIDISSSGVEPYSMAELRAVLGIEIDDLDRIVLQDGHSGGDPELREAVGKRYGDGDPAKVLVANGSGEAEFLFMTTFLSPGDEVVVVEPSYHTLGALAEAIGCRVVPWVLRYEDSFVPDMERLQYLVSARTRAIIVNFPHNPTGVSVSADTQRAIIDTASRSGIHLIWDTAFRDITYAADPLVDVSRLYERSVTFGTMSKAYGLPGLRIGWGIMPADLIYPCLNLSDYGNYAVSPLAERIALHAVRKAEVLLDPRRDQAAANLSRLDEWIADHQGLVEWVRPNGGVTAFPRLPGVADVEEFCRRLMREYGVLLMPGTCFGLPGHVRLGFGGTTKEFTEGLSRLADLLTTTASGR